ncbi:hypothetical protein B296_00009085 [Ensete ventricosum]|uniref:Uncharacterized protein n=1 Tax=Ensete ventricosum TaxID=4639 RepID=A0A426ZT21_ENSVE|nr:hypothetical protein B296_00009085 [Ensete ventricosum]
MGSRVLCRASRGGIARLFVSASSRRERLVGGFHSLREPAASSLIKVSVVDSSQLIVPDCCSDADKYLDLYILCHRLVDPGMTYPRGQVGASLYGKVQLDPYGKVAANPCGKLVAEKEELLKLKHKEIEKMQDKVLRSYAEMENVMDRTKREAENSKKFAIQNFAKSLLDVADNLGRASSVVKESFSKIDASKDTVGAVPLLKTLLEGVEMTEKQLSEVRDTPLLSQ